MIQLNILSLLVAFDMFFFFFTEKGKKYAFFNDGSTYDVPPPPLYVRGLKGQYHRDFVS